MTLCDAIRRLIAVRAQVDTSRRATLCAADLARIAFLEAFLAVDAEGALPRDVACALGARAGCLLGLVGCLERARRARLHRDGIGLIRAADGALQILDPEPVWAAADYSVDFPLDAIALRA